MYRYLMQVRPAYLASWLKKLLRIKRMEVETPFGSFYVDPVSNFGTFLLSGEEYEPEMRETVQQVLQPGDTFVDIGANEGYFSVIGAVNVGPTGRIITVEPQQRLQTVIERNLAINNIKNAQLVSEAVSDRPGTADLYISPDTNTGSTALHQSTRYRLPTESTATTTLTDLFDRLQISHADLVKLDIEGYEFEAVFGAAELFRAKRIKALALELHPAAITKRGLNPSEITAFLAECGYTRHPGFQNDVWVVAP